MQAAPSVGRHRLEDDRLAGLERKFRVQVSSQSEETGDEKSTGEASGTPVRLRVEGGGLAFSLGPKLAFEHPGLAVWVERVAQPVE
jgi:hypothetical protein